MKHRNFIKEQMDLANAKVEVVEGGLIAMVLGFVILSLFLVI